MLKLSIVMALSDLRRFIATMLAIFVGCVSFAVLTATVETQRLDATEIVNTSFNSTYDILVRPQNSISGPEAASGRVRPSFLTSTYGGITLAQWRQVQGMPAVQVAAPLAVMGVQWGIIPLEIDVTKYVGKAGHQLIRISSIGTSRGGLSHPTQSAYVYVTSNSLRRSVSPRTGPMEDDRHQDKYPCLGSQSSGPDRSIDSPRNPAARYRGTCYSRKEASTFKATIPIAVPLMTVGIDPESEAQLVHLDGAVVSGRYLSSGDSVQNIEASSLGYSSSKTMPITPALLSSEFQDVAYSVKVKIDRLPAESIKSLLAADYRTQQIDAVASARGASSLTSKTISMKDVFRRLVDADLPSSGKGATLVAASLLRPQEVKYVDGAQSLTVNAHAPDLSPYAGHGWETYWDPVPASVSDPAYRKVTALDTNKTRHFGGLGFSMIGRFDPSRVSQGEGISEVPLGVYQPANVRVMNDAGERSVGGTSLLPNLNPADYLQLQPTLLVPLSATLMTGQDYIESGDDSAPISALRVRVADAAGGKDPRGRERIRLVADQITAATGLQVDITTGSSLVNQQVELVQGRGLPNLVIQEPWTLKGVAVRLISAIDQKSVVLTVLILVSCSLTVGMITDASVSAHRQQLATLSAVGFSKLRVGWVALIGQTLFSCLSGAFAIMFSMVVSRYAGIALSPWVLISCVPLAAVLSVFGGAIPVHMATKGTVATALSPVRRLGLLRPKLRAPESLGVAAIAHRPGRLLAAVVSASIAATALGVVSVVQIAFNGAAVGTVLGDAVGIRTGASDLAAAILLLALGSANAFLVVVLGLIEDEPIWATAWAIGWSPLQIQRSLVAQGMVVSLLGSAIGLTATVVFSQTVLGGLRQSVVAAAGVASLVGVGMALVACAVPAVALVGRPSGIFSERRVSQ